jgi:putative membrane protein
LIELGNKVNYLKTYLKGMAMGAADVVPGVSGGTIAFITGILDTLLESIGRISPSLISIIRKQGVKAAFSHINGPFLVCVFGGILTSIFTLARLITYLLHNHPIPVWSFFFGLILISVVHMLKQVKGVTAARVVLFGLGFVIAWGITMLKPIALEMTYLNVFFGGCIAITAMILPGISGSFILLLLGLYTSVMGAVKSFDIGIIVTFAVGAVIGLLSFSRVLSLLLRKYHDATLVFLTGLMLGTLGKIWPWKEVLSFRENSKGEMVPLDERILSPLQYEHLTGQASLLTYAVIAMLAGILVVWGLERFANKER